MLPDPAQSHGACAGPLPPGNIGTMCPSRVSEPRLRLGEETLFPPRHAAGDPRPATPVLAAVILILATQVAGPVHFRGDVTLAVLQRAGTVVCVGQFRHARRRHPRRTALAMGCARCSARPRGRGGALRGRNMGSKRSPLCAWPRSAATPGGGLAGARNKEADQLGSIAIELIEPDLRPYSAFAFGRRAAGRGAPAGPDRDRQLSRVPWRARRRFDPTCRSRGADTATLKAAAVCRCRRSWRGSPRCRA